MGLVFSCGERVSHCGGGFSCWGAQAVGYSGSAAAACGISSCVSWALEQRVNSSGTWA